MERRILRLWCYGKAHSATSGLPRLRFFVTCRAARGGSCAACTLHLILTYVEKGCRVEAVSVPQISLVNLTSD